MNVFSKFETELSVRPDDIDLYQHVHSTRYLDYVLAARFEQMGPEGEQAALGGLDGMDATAFGGKECTLACSRFAEPALMGGAVDIAFFELFGG